MEATKIYVQRVGKDSNNTKCIVLLMLFFFVHGGFSYIKCELQSTNQVHEFSHDVCDASVYVDTCAWMHGMY